MTATDSSEAYDFVSCNTDSGKFDTACFADFKISNSPSALLNSLSPATEHAILARAARVTNRNIATPAPATRRKLTAPAPTPVGTPPGPTPATTPTGSDSEEEEFTMSQASSNPLQYSGAFKESVFVLRQAMKAKVTKKGTRTSEELLAYQTDQVIETAHLDGIQMQKIMELQTGTGNLGPIKAVAHMRNTRMTPTKWCDSSPSCIGSYSLHGHCANQATFATHATSCR